MVRGPKLIALSSTESCVCNHGQDLHRNTAAPRGGAREKQNPAETRADHEEVKISYTWLDRHCGTHETGRRFLVMQLTRPSMWCHISIRDLLLPNSHQQFSFPESRRAAGEWDAFHAGTLLLPLGLKLRTSINEMEGYVGHIITNSRDKDGGVCGSLPGTRRSMTD